MVAIHSTQGDGATPSPCVFFSMGYSPGPIADGGCGGEPSHHPSSLRGVATLANLSAALGQLTQEVAGADGVSPQSVRLSAPSPEVLEELKEVLIRSVQ